MIDIPFIFAGLLINLLAALVILAIARAIGRRAAPAVWATIILTPLIGAIVLAISPKSTAAPRRANLQGPDHASKLTPAMRQKLARAHAAKRANHGLPSSRI